jgi:hypothetical protein
MSSTKQKQQVRPEQCVKLIDSLAMGLGGILRKSSGLVPLVATADLPVATHLPDGIVVIDITVNAIKYTKDGVWTLLA